ncbi:MAG TPA: hypothetical protein VJ870_01615 [Amycolatopsis sp.]|nr:hypothetical protein [Amycolatopsis sp.]
MRIAVLAVLLLVTACGARPGAGQHCTAIGAPAGIAIEVAPPVASMTSLTLDVCWNGSCHAYPVPLAASTTPAEQTCTGAMCAVPLRQTGGRHGFADIPDLPTIPVEVTVSGHTADVTPRLQYPNGPDCGAGGAQAGLVLDETGLRAR